MKEGSGVNPDCEETKDCYIPYEVTVDVGGEVTWISDDMPMTFHTATSVDSLVTKDVTLTGTDVPNGFDSGLFRGDETYTHKFEQPGTYLYFCLIHPWMKGIVYVEGEAGGDHTGGDHETGGDHGDAMHPMAIDEVMAMVEAGDASEGSPMAIDVTFTDADGNGLEHVNYNLTVMQDGEVIFADEGAHSHTGNETHMTGPLPMAASDDSPIDIEVELLGFGVEDITGPSGTVATQQVVPEFGAVAVAVLGIAIVSIVALTAKSRVIPRI